MESSATETFDAATHSTHLSLPTDIVEKIASFRPLAEEGDIRYPVGQSLHNTRLAST